jgi:hypothetical protein
MLHDIVEELLRFFAVVGAVVADVNVERQPLALGPGMKREVGLREEHDAGVAAALELMKARVHRREPGRGDEAYAGIAHACSVEKELRIAAAAGEVTDEMQTIHFRTLQNAKAQPAAYSRVPGHAFHSRLSTQQRSSIALNSCKTS